MSRLRILLGSRDADQRHAIEASLREAGWNVIDSVCSVTGAIREIRRGRIGCAIVCDDLEDISGLQALGVLRAIDSRLAIIYVARRTSADLEARARQCDIFYYHIDSECDSELIDAVASAIGPPPPGDRRAARILVVDDDPAFVATVCSMLQSRGYEVLCASSAGEGLGLAREQRPDLIVLDIVMESATDGLHLCHQARSDPVLRHTPLVAVSAVSSAVVPLPLADGARSLGVDLYFEKPLDPEEFLSGVGLLLGNGG